jgi:alkylation response protein AidB-like acyl-CoA dehydrogenase
VTHGSDEQKARYLRPLFTNEEIWCQLFSEPGAGSDLASVQTKAERDGDEWVITGQKVWTSGGQTADLGMLLARTDPDAPKHTGITYFAFSMDQPGVEVRPLREMTGRALFSEVFMDGARVRDDAIIGGLDKGWAVANTTLAFERAGLGGGGSGAGGGAFPGKKGGMLDKRVGDLAEGVGRGRAVQPSAFGGSYERLRDISEKVGAAGDPLVRQRLAELYTLTEIGRMTALRMKAARSTGKTARPWHSRTTARYRRGRVAAGSRRSASARSQAAPAAPPPTPRAACGWKNARRRSAPCASSDGSHPRPAPPRSGFPAPVPP